MRKVQFGCGSNRLDGWENHDMDIDITKPLPFENDSVDFIFIEHLIEHVTHQEAYKFLQETYRILKPDGVIRIAFPDLERINIQAIGFGADERYSDFLEAKGWGNPIYNIIFNHGHKSVWTKNMMEIFLQDANFICKGVSIYESAYPELQKLEGHGREIGEEFNVIETSVIEGIK